LQYGELLMVTVPVIPDKETFEGKNTVACGAAGFDWVTVVLGMFQV